MDAANITRAAELLVEARRSGKPLSELPPECKPRTVPETNAIAAEITRLLGWPIGGWKITFLHKPRNPPFIVPLFESLVFASPARIPLSLTPSLYIEPEITFRLLQDIPPRKEHYQPGEVADAVIACPSLEIVHTRFDTSRRTVHEMLAARDTALEANADHLQNGAFIIGEGRSDWRQFDFARLPVVMRCGDRVVVENIGGHAYTDPFLAVVVLANEMRHREGMKAGQIVATGSFTGHHKVEPDQPIVGEFEGFGHAEATFASK